MAFVFLVNLILTPVAELGEILDQTQQGIAGWRKVLDLLDQPIDVVEPEPGAPLPAGALEVRGEGVVFAYRDGPPVLHERRPRDCPPASTVAVVGETGSGKTTFAKLLCRLADPTDGRILVGGVDLRDVARLVATARSAWCPRTGSCSTPRSARTCASGRAGATDDEVEAAFVALGLDWWVAGLPDGLDTEVGERGENLSVGERQLVALARAQLADPGLLILDEATSPRSTPRPSGRSATPCAAWPRAARRSASPTGCRPPRRPTWCWCSTPAGSSSRAPTTSSSPQGGRYAALYASWLGNTQAA